MAEQASRIAFAHTSQFHSEAAEKLAERLLHLAPGISVAAGSFILRRVGRRRRKRRSSWPGSFIWKADKGRDIAWCRGRQSYHGARWAR
jgi:hypothetical protein